MVLLHCLHMYDSVVFGNGFTMSYSIQQDDKLEVEKETGKQRSGPQNEPRNEDKRYITD